MSRANPVTKLGLIELARLAHEYLDSQLDVLPSTARILRWASEHRVYGRFQGRDLVDKIRARHIKKRDASCVVRFSLEYRIRRRRIKQVSAVLGSVFALKPSGGLTLTVKWMPDVFTFKYVASKGGYFNNRYTAVHLTLRLHPHWHRRLGAICQRMGRFFLDIESCRSSDESKVQWRGLEVKKGCGYTFRCIWVTFTHKEIKENALDQLEPWQTTGLYGLDPVPAVGSILRGAAVTAGQ